MAENHASESKTLSEWLQSLDMQETLRNLGNPIVKEQIAVLTDLATLFPQSRHVPFEVVQLDYMQTGEQIKMLTDIRFKLLAFVPPIVGGGVTLLSSKAASTAGDHILTGSIGVLGFVLTLGIVLYDLRNSQLYNAHLHRAKVLEGVLGCIRSGAERLWPTPSTGGGKAYGGLQSPGAVETGGVHTQRAIALGSILGQRIAHDPALSIVYGVALGAWIFPIVRGFGTGFWMVITDWMGTSIKLTGGSGAATSVVALSAAVTSAIYFVARIKAEDRGWPVTHLGYDKPKERAWAKGYHEKIAHVEIENRKKDKELHLFKVTARDENLSGVVSRLRIRTRSVTSRRMRILNADKNQATILATNQIRQMLRIRDPMLEMVEVKNMNVLIGFNKGKVVIEHKIPIHLLVSVKKIAKISHGDWNTALCQPVNVIDACCIAGKIHGDADDIGEHSIKLEYYLCVGGLEPTEQAKADFAAGPTVSGL